jgi:hypothetical protein
MTKPEVTKIIEGANTPQTSMECAQSLMKGLSTGQYMIVTDLLADVLRCTVRGKSRDITIKYICVYSTCCYLNRCQSNK